MDANVIDSIPEIIIAAQCLALVLGSIVVLQGVLNKCSNALRLAFIVCPIGASLGFLDMLDDGIVPMSAIILNSAIMLLLYWLWNQKQMFLDLEQLMRNKESQTPYSFTSEVKAILSCFAIWMLRKVNPKLEDRCVVCEQILPK